MIKLPGLLTNSLTKRGAVEKHPHRARRHDNHFVGSLPKPLVKDELNIRFGAAEPLPKEKRGLTGIPADNTQISAIYPEKKLLLYRGYPISTLMEHSNFEETSYLLLNGKLPNKDELKTFNEALAKNRGISDVTIDILKTALTSPKYKSLSMMDDLQLAVQLIKHDQGSDLLDDTSESANTDKSIKLIAKMPTLVAAIHRIRHNQEPIPPDPTLSHSENFLYMLSGKKPDPYVAEVFDKTLIAYGDHSFNASTFTDRVVASTLSDMYSSASAAIGALKGPLHGGANYEVLKMFEEIAQSGQTPREYVERKLAMPDKKDRIIMGFGHKVYKNGDPRADILLKMQEEVANRTGNQALQQISKDLLEVMEEKKPNLKPNVDYPIAAVYKMLGIDPEMNTAIFAMGRMTGWAAHVKELQADNALYRPLAVYTGEGQDKPLDYTPMESR